jgi:pyruvate,water dikinase
MISQHMRFTAAALVPTGDFLAHVGDWTGLPTADLLGLLRGTAPVSAGASAELEQLVATMRQDLRARELPASEDEPGRVLEALRSLGEARLTYRIRDERGVFSDIWASGIMRRAVLAGGRRLAGKGRIRDVKSLVDAGFEEMRSLLAGADGPSADELAARAEYRASHRAKEAPSVLGPPPPDLYRLPPAAARMMRAIGIALGSLFGSSEAPHKEHTLRGLAASRGVYEGPARRVSSPSEFDRIVRGDVLVTESTTKAFNILLPLLGAIVTDSGGLLSHSAIVAREYGIPGVVGTREAPPLKPCGVCRSSPI